MTAKERSENAHNAVKARWAKYEAKHQGKSKAE